MRHGMFMKAGLLVLVLLMAGCAGPTHYSAYDADYGYSPGYRYYSYPAPHDYDYPESYRYERRERTRDYDVPDSYRYYRERTRERDPGDDGYTRKYFREDREYR